jgi:hypothetical protein
MEFQVKENPCGSCVLEPIDDIETIRQGQRMADFKGIYMLF